MRVRVAAARRETHAEEDPSTAAEGVVTVWRASSELADALREGACFAVTGLKPCRGGGGWDSNAPAVAASSGLPVVFMQSTNLTTWRPLSPHQWCGAPQRQRQPHAVMAVGELRPGVEVDAVALLVHVGAPCAATRGQTCQVHIQSSTLSPSDFYCAVDLHASAKVERGSRAHGFPVSTDVPPTTPFARGCGAQWLFLADASCTREGTPLARAMLLAVELRLDHAAFTTVEPAAVGQVVVLHNVTFNRTDHRNGLHVAGGGDATVVRVVGGGTGTGTGGGGGSGGATGATTMEREALAAARQWIGTLDAEDVAATVRRLEHLTAA